MTKNDDIRTNLDKFGKRGWALKPYDMWGSDKPCPPRLVVNPYKGCTFQHQYCYIAPPAYRQDGFRTHLQDRIRKAKKLGLDKLVVMVSSSTDPFQPIESKYRDSHYALQELLTNDFPVLVMTRNPQTLLEEDYLEITRHPKLNIDVSIPSLEENNPDSIYYSPIAAPLNETYDVMRRLTYMGKNVRVKIEPVVPTANGIDGQSREELDEIVGRSVEAGVKMIISKTMRLNHSVPREMYEKLIGYYEKNGINEGSTLALSIDVRKELLQPVLDACEEHEIDFCSCVDSDSLDGDNCRVWVPDHCR
ncbi:MAG: hypothetical protein ISS93_00790 [Candidatus Aenigmarchaeota archaeon]|nr:hypothetical protein [Candidatus Aenigmarchaeota archaeon]